MFSKGVQRQKDAQWIAFKPQPCGLWIQQYKNAKTCQRRQESYSHELQLRQRCAYTPLITAKIFSAEPIWTVILWKHTEGSRKRKPKKPQNLNICSTFSNLPLFLVFQQYLVWFKTAEMIFILIYMTMCIRQWVKCCEKFHSMRMLYLSIFYYSTKDSHQSSWGSKEMITLEQNSIMLLQTNAVLMTDLWSPQSSCQTLHFFLCVQICRDINVGKADSALYTRHWHWSAK